MVKTLAVAVSLASAATFGVGFQVVVARPASAQSSSVEQSALAAVDHDRGVVSANEEALIKAQVTYTVNKYYEYFSSGEVERIPQERTGSIAVAR